MEKLPLDTLSRIIPISQKWGKNPLTPLHREYWFVTENGGAAWCFDVGRKIDRDRKKVGNYYYSEGNLLNKLNMPDYEEDTLETNEEDIYAENDYL